MLALVAATFVMASCEGDKGEVGPAGPAGPAGPVGPASKDFFETFDGATVADVFTTDGAAPWSMYNYSQVQDGTNNGMMSGAIGHTQKSNYHMSVNMPEDGVVSFQTMVSSEEGWDYLVWYVDGVAVDGVSGIGGPFTFYVPVPQGEHTITWAYEKDDSYIEGADAVLIDNISIADYTTSRIEMPELPATIMTLSQAGTIKK